MACKVGNLEIYMGPQECGGPDDLKKTIIGFIDGAKKTLDIAVQELDCLEIAEAIVRAKQRKVSVRVVLEGDYLKFAKPKSKPFSPRPRGKLEPNLEIQNALFRAAIDVKSDYNTKIFHQKFIIRDRKDMLTGSTNFTDTGVSTNLNHIVIVKDKGVAKEYGKEFKEIRQGRFGKLSVGHEVAPKTLSVSGVPIKVLFAPDHNPEMEIMKQMVKAAKRIDFAVFTFARSSGIDDAMIKLVQSGLKVRGVMDGTMASQKWAPLTAIRKAGADLYRVPKGGAVRKLHHKIMVIDERVVIAGSFNYTKPATQLNDENILVIGDIKAGTAKSQQKIARSVIKEIDRIIVEFGKR